MPASTLPGEQAWPSQPFSALPALSPLSASPADAWGLTPWDRKRCRDAMGGLRNEWDR